MSAQKISVISSKEEVNKSLLSAIFKFKPLSELKSFLSNKTGVEKTYYSLAEVKLIIQFILKYPPCDPDLDHFEEHYQRRGTV